MKVASIIHIITTRRLKQFLTKTVQSQINLKFYNWKGLNPYAWGSQSSETKILKSKSYCSVHDSWPISFTNPGETAILVSYKKEKLGTTCFYNRYISRTKTKTNMAGYFNKKAGRKTRTKKGADDEETTSPSYGSLWTNKKRKKEKKKPANS